MHYLVTIRRLQPGRLFTIKGGFRQKLEVELYALPRDLPAPYLGHGNTPHRSQALLSAAHGDGWSLSIIALRGKSGDRWMFPSARAVSEEGVVQ